MRWLPAAALLAWAAVSPAVAGQFLVGASAGRADVKLELELLDTLLDLDPERGYKLFAGYRFFRYLGVEGGYVNLGSKDERDLGLEYRAESTGWDLFAVGALPVGRRLEVFGKAGLIRWRAEASATDGVQSLTRREDGTDFGYGFGVALRFSLVSVRAEWESFDLESADRLTFTSVGVDFRF